MLTQNQKPKIVDDITEPVKYYDKRFRELQNLFDNNPIQDGHFLGHSRMGLG